MYLLLFSASACRLKSQGFLPQALDENSGLVALDSTFVFHNDSGDGAYLYRYQTQNKTLQRDTVLSVLHRDWEDLCPLPQSSDLLLGDLGNNRNQRRDLCLYRLDFQAQTQSWHLRDSFPFYYPEQRDFPPQAPAQHFDCEALFAQGDYAFLLSKNRSKPQDKWVYLSQVDLRKKNEKQPALRVDSLRFSGQWHWIFSVTSAALSPDGQELAILSGNRLRIFRNFQAPHFLQAKQRRSYRLRWRQWEAVSYDAQGQIWLSCERSRLGKAKLYRFKRRS